MEFNLPSCRTWRDVEALFDRVNKELHRDPENPENPENPEIRELRAMKSFQLALGMTAIKYDFDKDSVQRRIVFFLRDKRAYLKVEDLLHEQNENRLMLAFRLTARSVFGEDWESRTKGWADALDYELAYDSPQVIATAIIKDKPEILKNLTEMSRWTKAAKSTPRHKASHPFESPQVCIARHWTDPDFPLWLMSDKALSQAVRYLSAGSFLSEKSVVTTINRLGLERCRHRGIAKVFFDPSSESTRRSLKGYEYRKYLISEMNGVVVYKRGAEETRTWGSTSMIP